MKTLQKAICMSIAAATLLCASACDLLAGTSSSPSSGPDTPSPVDYVAQDKPTVDKAMEDGELSVLTLGNSFSVDAMEYAAEIAENLGLSVVFGNLYEPGCSIGEHLDYFQRDSKVFEYYFYQDGKWTKTNEYTSREALVSYEWDYVILQHDPDQSGWQNTYWMLPDLITEVKKLRPNAALAWHMTWAYQSDSTQNAFKQYNSDQMEMYRQIIAATKKKVLDETEISMVIPSGTVIQNARTSSLGDTLTRDGYHLSLDNGRYLAGVSYVAKLSGVDVSKLTYKPEGVTDTTRKIAIDAVQKAMQKPFEVTKVNL